DEVWGFHFYETLLRKVIAYLHGHVMAENKFVLYRVSPDVKVAVLHTDILATIRIVLYGKRRERGCIQNVQVTYQDLNISGGNVLVLGFSFDNRSRNLYHKFPAEGPGFFENIFRSS